MFFNRVFCDRTAEIGWNPHFGSISMNTKSQQENSESDLFINSSVQTIHYAKKMIRQQKYSRVLRERQIKILNLKINHYISRLSICKQPIRIKNYKIKVQRNQNKRDRFWGQTLDLSIGSVFWVINKPERLKEVDKKMQKKYFKKKENWSYKRTKWKLKLKKMKILISQSKENQSKFYQKSNWHKFHSKFHLENFEENIHELIKKAQKKWTTRVRRRRFEKLHLAKLSRPFSRSTRKISPYPSFNCHPKENLQITRTKIYCIFTASSLKPAIQIINE